MTIPQVIAHDTNLETHGFFIKFIRIFTVPLLNALPAYVIQKMMKSSSHDAAEVVRRGGSTHALEAMYTRYHRGFFSRGIIQGFADFFWHHCISQPKALRNRLKLVENSLHEEILRIAENKQPGYCITILSVGGGSARAIMHTIHRLRSHKFSNPVRVTNIDKDAKAIELGKEIARTSHLSDIFRWIQGDARELSSFLQPASIDIVEMVGLLDYFSDEKGLMVMKSIYAALKENGLFIVANVHPNSEMPFVYKTGWPHMYYRNPEDIERLLRHAGFTGELSVMREPLNVHIIAWARK